ncbi:MAG: hypothetical protein JNJ77_09715 [Planctomycetia bacterium]|nr:hypothetical protein [Planctomycetia bacterium]
MTRMLGKLVLLTLAMLAGCKTFSDTDFTSLWEEKKAPCGTPNELIAFWQEGVDVQLMAHQGGMPSPGFAGRVIFQQQKPGKPAETIAVNGTLIVRMYEDKPLQGGQLQPLETWTILPEHLPMLMRKDLSGWGYSLWLPWNTYNNALRSVRMTVEYQGNDGTKLMGTPMQIQIQDAHRMNEKKPELSVQRVPKKTWQ